MTAPGRRFRRHFVHQLAAVFLDALGADHQRRAGARCGASFVRKAVQHLRRHRQQQRLGLGRFAQIAGDTQIVRQRHAGQEGIAAGVRDALQHIVLPHPKLVCAPGGQRRQRQGRAPGAGAQNGNTGIRFGLGHVGRLNDRLIIQEGLLS